MGLGQLYTSEMLLQGVSHTILPFALLNGVFMAPTRREYWGRGVIEDVEDVENGPFRLRIDIDNV